MPTLNLHSVLCQLYLNKNNFLRILMYSRVVRSEAEVGRSCTRNQSKLQYDISGEEV